MEYFKHFFKYLIPYKGYAFLNIVCNIFYAILSTLSFLAFIPMLDVLFKDTKRITVKPVRGESIKQYLEDSMNFFATQQIEQRENGELFILGAICGVIIILFFLKNLFNYLAVFFVSFLRNGIIKDIRNDLFKKTISLNLSYYSERKKGDILSRMTSDVSQVEWAFLMFLEMLVRDPLTILITLVAMFSISTKLTLFIFLFLPFSGLLIAIIGKKLRKGSEILQKENGVFLSLIEEGLSGLKVVKGFTAEPFFNKKFQASTGRLNHTMNSVMKKQSLASPTSEFMGVVVISGILWYGGQLVLVENAINGSTFITFMVLAYNILTPAKSISNALYSIKRGNASAERILEILHTPNTVANSKNAIEKENLVKQITFNNISFKYENEYVLKNFSLTIPKGKMVALVGQSGSGKSTIANLITRFYDVNKGSIEIDGIDIKQVTKKSLRALEGLVTQDAILFNDSIKNNVLLGLQKTDEEIITALKVANAWEFVKELPNGINTNIGDSGNKLSGGQKQRLSIARAVLKNPPIMILDEATSALDTESEQLVQKALENLMQHRTSIVIAHRLSTIQNADIIVVMNKGEIIEQGTHKELIEKKGEYFKLVSIQSLG